MSMWQSSVRTRVGNRRGRRESGETSLERRRVPAVALRSALKEPHPPLHTVLRERHEPLELPTRRARDARHPAHRDRRACHAGLAELRLHLARERCRDPPARSGPRPPPPERSLRCRDCSECGRLEARRMPRGMSAGTRPTRGRRHASPALSRTWRAPRRAPLERRYARRRSAPGCCTGILGLRRSDSRKPSPHPSWLTSRPR